MLIVGGVAFWIFARQAIDNGISADPISALVALGLFFFACVPAFAVLIFGIQLGEEANDVRKGSVVQILLGIGGAFLGCLFGAFLLSFRRVRVKLLVLAALAIIVPLLWAELGIVGLIVGIDFNSDDDYGYHD